MNQDQIKQNVLSPAAWLRILFMAGFAVAAWLTSIVLGVIVLGQVLIVLVTGLPNPNLQRFGLIAGAYLFELIQFMLYNTEDRPFPFSPFPDPPMQADVAADDDFHDASWETGQGAGMTGMQNNAADVPPTPDPEQDRPIP